jgi:hypothetical protein
MYSKRRIQMDEADLPLVEGYTVTAKWNTRGKVFYGVAQKKIDGK